MLQVLCFFSIQASFVNEKHGLLPSVRRALSSFSTDAGMAPDISVLSGGSLQTEGTVELGTR